MKLNLHILREDLKPMVIDSRLLSDKTQLDCFTVRPYVQGMPLDQGYIYVAKAVDLSSEPVVTGTPSLICVGEPPSEYYDAPINLLVVDESCDVGEVLDAVATCYGRYDEWDCSLREIVLSRGTPEELGLASQPLFENPLYCQGAGFTVIFLCAGDVDELTQAHKDHLSTIIGHYEFKPGDKLPEHTIVRLFSIKRYLDADTMMGLNMYENPGSQTRAWCYNIGSENAHFGRILNFELFRELTDRDAALLFHLAPYVERLLRDATLETAFDADTMYYCARDLLSNVTVAPTTMKYALDEMQWRPDDRYFCMVANITGERVASLDMQTIAAAINMNMPENYHIVFGENLVYLFNLSKMGISHKKIIADVIPVFRDVLLRAGSGTPFRGIGDLYYYYIQAMEALQYGAIKHPDYWHFRYEDYSFDILITRCLAGQPSDALRPYGLKKLDDHDKKYGSHLAELLKLYLVNNMSVTETARASFSSRSTCIRHLQQIRDISQLDLEDARVRLQLLIAFLADTANG